MSHRRVDGREDDMVKIIGVASYGDKSIKRGTLQARGAYKEVPSLAEGYKGAT